MEPSFLSERSSGCCRAWVNLDSWETIYLDMICPCSHCLCAGVDFHRPVLHQRRSASSYRLRTILSIKSSAVDCALSILFLFLFWKEASVGSACPSGRRISNPGFMDCFSSQTGFSEILMSHSQSPFPEGSHSFFILCDKLPPVPWLQKLYPTSRPGEVFVLSSLTVL